MHWTAPVVSGLRRAVHHTIRKAGTSHHVPSEFLITSETRNGSGVGHLADHAGVSGEQQRVGVQNFGRVGVQNLYGKRLMAHTRQSRPDSGLAFQVNVLKTFEGVVFWQGSSTSSRTMPGSAERSIGRVSSTCTANVFSMSIGSAAAGA